MCARVWRQGLKHMTIKERHMESHINLDIHLTRDDFDDEQDLVNKIDSI